jgi:hypothetical protein
MAIGVLGSSLFCWIFLRWLEELVLVCPVVASRGKILSSYSPA